MGNPESTFHKMCYSKTIYLYWDLPDGGFSEDFSTLCTTKKMRTKPIENGCIHPYLDSTMQ